LPHAPRRAHKAHHAAEHAALRQRGKGTIGGQQVALLARHDLHGQPGSLTSFGGTIQQEALGPGNHRV
jgi:hypothetical protein